MIWNCGQLPVNWTVEDMLSKHSSRPRNPDIAAAFFRSGYVESWGRGMDKMKNLCTEARLPVPEFSCQGDDFWAIFRKDIYNETFLRNKGLNDRQIKALLYVRENGKITSSQYQTLNSISKRTSINDLIELVEKYGLLEQAGTSINIYYQLR